MFYLLPIAALPIGLYALTNHLRGEDLSQYDDNVPLDFPVDPNSDAVQKINAFLYANFERPAKGHKGGEPIKEKRRRFDQMGLSRKFKVDFSPLTIGDLPGEWVHAKDADPDRRLLYLHGGAFSVGSALSHRAITAKLAELTKASICAINYRLAPEHKRKDAIADCRAAYLWLMENGPSGNAPIKSMAIGGDSAGGNLALGILNWARDENLFPVNAAFAFSPGTDSTFSSPSFEANIETDHILRPMIQHALKIPRSALLYLTWKSTGYKPTAPEISPVRADLRNLPPTLLQVSTSEVLYLDSVRYYNKSKRAGNDVEIQTWNHVPHVWQAFDTLLPQSNQAMAEVLKFLNRYGF